MAAVTIWWIRKDFRLADNPALREALNGGGPVIPLFILDPETEEQLGAAPKWRLHQAIRVFGDTLGGLDSRIILRRGGALDVLREVISEAGAARVVWGRHYDAPAKARDTAVKAGLKEDGIGAVSVNTHLLFEPWTIETKTGGPYRVYTPFKNTCFDKADFRDPLAAPSKIPVPEAWPESDVLDDWQLERAMNRGGEIVAKYSGVGEAVAGARLEDFLEKISRYNDDRDRPAVIGTSRLSENFAWGEISPLSVWHRVQAAADTSQDGPRVYLQELVWREFAYHLLHHYPALPEKNWREDWDAFDWRGDNEDAERWRRGMTGITAIDAAMRELYTTGYMHNRMRMLTASLLTKHLMTHWTVGERWFRETLVDWDPASNAMGWQWAAGSGPDASPFFRIFNPDTQREKFDPKGIYVRRWLGEKMRGTPAHEAEDFFAAIPNSWNMAISQPYPAPIVDLAEGRKRALAAYSDMKDKRG